MQKIKYLSLTVFLLFALFGIFFYFRSHEYRVIHPERGNIHEAVYGLGKVKSNNRFEVIAGIISTITERHVNEGDVVEKGTPLLKLNEQAVFRAPFSGTVTYVRLYEGETAVPNIAVLRLEDLNQKYIELSLEQESVLRVKLGQPARISFESLRGQILSGKVSAIFPRDDEFIVRISVDDLQSNILPGMTADVTIEVGAIQNAVILPLSAIKNGMIVLRKDGEWKKIKVEIGQIDGLSAEIKNPPLSLSDEIRIKNGG